MVIGINGYEAAVPRFGFDKETGLPNRVGSSEFCFQLLTALSIIDKKNEYFIYLPTNPASDMPKEERNWHYVVFSSIKLWTLLGLSKKLFSDRNKIDVFFSPTHYLPLYVPCPSVISILDVSYLHFPKLFKKKDLYQLKLWGRYSIGKAKKIITISKASKNDIIKAYGVSEDKVVVVCPGIKSEIQNSKSETNTKLKMQNSKSLKEKFGIDKEFILFVGTLQPRKNIGKLIEAFSRLKTQDLRLKTDLELIIVGKKGWMYEDILNAPKKFGIADRVKFLDSVTDEDLPSFYKNAICFVLPSLYEGFGLPILEAMKYGCPVITSNVSSLPEAGGDAAVYFNPESVEDIAEKIEKVISSEKLRQEMVKKGYEQVKKFSWEKTARETLKVLQELSIKK
ncbi:MAG: glycosyltransferase family 1 protein [Patescibacteria group bacterium]